MIADWSAEDFVSAEAAAREAVRLLRRAEFTFDREVTRVSVSGQEALDPLLTVGWQAPGEHEVPAHGYGSAGDGNGR